MSHSLTRHALSTCSCGAAGALADGSIAVISAVPMAMALLGLLLALLAKFVVEAAAGGMVLESVRLQ